MIKINQFFAVDDLSLFSSELLPELELSESSTRDSSGDMNEAFSTGSILCFASLSKVVDWRKSRKRPFSFYNTNVSKYT